MFKVPKSKPLGKRLWTVQSPIEPVTFTRSADATAFKQLLKKSTNGYTSVIVRREIVEEGYIPTYGDGK